MTLENVRETWERYGDFDALWAILTVPGLEGNRWDEDAFFRSGQEEIARLLDRLEDLGLPRHRNRALDFGCGVGRLTQALGDHFETVVGVDIAKSMVALAQQSNRHGSRCRYIHNAADNLEVLPDGNYDLVYSSYVLQHIPPTSSRRYVEEFVRLLTPGGLAVFQLPIERTRTHVRLQRALASPLRFRIISMLARRWWRDRLPRRHTAPVRPSDMEMYEIPEADVRRWVHDAGGQTLQVTPIFAAISDYASIKWEHRCYFVTRAASP